MSVNGEDEHDTAARREQLAVALASVRERIAAACAEAGRDAAEVALLAVTKTFPASDVALLRDLGLSEFCENRVQEAAGKVADVTRLRPDAAARWHMVGRLQRNKARSVAGWAHQVHSVDSARLVDVLDRAALRAGETGERTGALDVLIQVSLDDRQGRGGCAPEDVLPLAEGVTRKSGLRLCGLMAVAPLGEPPEPAFARLAVIAERLRGDHPDA
ncbi:MAG: YggS family pyridoxal phosphate enzyme, partial [Sciscionella sp.]